MNRVQRIVYSNCLSYFLVLMNNCVVVSKKNSIVKAYMTSPRVKLFLEKTLDDHLSSLTLMSRLVFLMSNLSQLYFKTDFLILLVKFFDRLLIFLKNTPKESTYSLIDLISLFHLAKYFLSTVNFNLNSLKELSKHSRPDQSTPSSRRRSTRSCCSGSPSSTATSSSPKSPT